MGLETIDPHTCSLKEHTKIHKIPKVGVNRPSSEQDTAIWKCQNFTKKCMACWTLPDNCPAGHTFLCKFWHFQMAVSCLLLGLFTPNLGILWISVCSFRLCRSIVANPIIYRLVLSPPTYEIRQFCFWGEHSKGLSNQADIELDTINAISAADIAFIMSCSQAIVNWLNALDQSDFSYISESDV